LHDVYFDELDLCFLLYKSTAALFREHKTCTLLGWSHYLHCLSKC